jgi:hypothetical protein
MSFNALDSLYSRLDVSERISESLKLKNITASSVVKERRTAKYFPMNGSAFQYGNAAGFANSSQIITYRLTDSQSYFDMESMYLNFNVQLGESFGASARQALPANPTIAQSAAQWKRDGGRHLAA